jgi:hypothetical protein
VVVFGFVMAILWLHIGVVQIAQFSNDIKLNVSGEIKHLNKTISNWIAL